MAWSREIEAFARDYFASESVDPNNRAAHYYWTRKRRLVLDLIRIHFDEFGPSPMFVDLGCGDGIDLAFYATYVNRRLRSSENGGAQSKWRFIGIEGFPEAIASCRKRLSEHGIADAEVRVANITGKLPLADSEADILYCSEVLEHIPDIDAMIAEMQRVVRPGGYVLMTTPNEPNVFQRSYWSSAHDRRMRESLPRVRFGGVEIAGETVDLYGHISLHRNHEWDEFFRRRGFNCVDYRRGAATYGAYPFLSKTPFHQLRLAFERMLDFLPLSLSRNLSDQVIALYRRDDA